MNSDEQLIYRLLQSFSVNDIRDIFNIDTSIKLQKDIIYNVQKVNNETNIKELLFRNFSLLKQHIYFFNIKGIVTDNIFDGHPFLFQRKIISSSNKVFYFMFKEDYGVFNPKENKIETISFYRPIKVEIINLSLIVSINILERDISRIIGAKVININRKSNDDDILNSIITYNKDVIFTIKDLNKGVKYLWENDNVDALKVSYKKSKSTSSEIMDEEFLLKKQMPEVYNDIISKPMDTTIFKYLSENYVRHFTVNPREGYMSFNTYPYSKDGIDNIVKAVLQNN